MSEDLIFTPKEIKAIDKNGIQIVHVNSGVNEWGAVNLVSLAEATNIDWVDYSIEDSDEPEKLSYDIDYQDNDGKLREVSGLTGTTAVQKAVRKILAELSSAE